ETSVLVDKDGMGSVLGKGPAYFVLADHPPQLCQPKRPLTYLNYKIWKKDSGATFNLKNRPTTGYYVRNIKNGVIDSDPYSEIPSQPSREVKQQLAEVEKLRRDET